MPQEPRRERGRRRGAEPRRQGLKLPQNDERRQPSDSASKRTPSKRQGRNSQPQGADVQLPPWDSRHGKKGQVLPGALPGGLAIISP